KSQHALFYVCWCGDNFHLNRALPGILPPIERLLRVVQGIRVHPASHEHDSRVELLVDHVLINAGRIGEDFIARQLVTADLESFSYKNLGLIEPLPYMRRETLADSAACVTTQVILDCLRRIGHESIRHMEAAGPRQAQLNCFVINEAG